MKYIRKFLTNKDNISSEKSNRYYKVFGDIGAVFSLQIRDEDGKYYNFTTGLFTTTFTSENRLSYIELTDSIYEGSVVIPADTDGNVYTFQVFADSNKDTNIAKTLSTVYITGSGDSELQRSAHNPLYYQTSVKQLKNSTIGAVESANSC